MATHTLKTGANSVLLGETYYRGYFSPKTDKLLKVTRIIKGHDEYTHLDRVRAIKNYDRYFSIPGKELIKVLEDSVFVEYLKQVTVKHKMNIFDGPLYCSYVDCAGQIDVMDSLMRFSPRVWRSAKSILRFSNQVLTGLKFLHEKKMAHLDIKPENIMIDLYTNTFKIIDFGFSSVYPFDDYVTFIRGTPGYFPKELDGAANLGLPKIRANDLDVVKGTIPMKINRNFVYRIDSYCFGRVMNLVYVVYLENTNTMLENNSKKKIKTIIKYLLEDDVNMRLTPSQVLTVVN